MMIVQCFVVRSILEDHLGGPDDDVSYPRVVERVKLSGLMADWLSAGPLPTIDDYSR